MTGKRIRHLYRVLLQECEKHSIPVPADFKPGYHGAAPAIVNQPDFGWQFVHFFLNARIFMPPEVHDMELRRAYGNILTPSYGDCLPEVFEFTCKGNEYQAHSLRAYLLCRDITLQDIADRFDHRVAVIETYEKLFFNVRDRFNEPIYISSLIYPSTRAIELNPDYLVKLPADAILRQVAYREGVKGVERLLGLRSPVQDFPSTEANENALEASLLSNARWLVELGALNQADSTGIKQARSLLLAKKKQKALAQQNQDDIAGLGALGIHYSIMDTVKNLQSKDIAQRRQLHQEKLMGKETAAPGVNGHAKN